MIAERKIKNGTFMLPGNDNTGKFYTYEVFDYKAKKFAKAVTRKNVK